MKRVQESLAADEVAAGSRDVDPSPNGPRHLATVEGPLDTPDLCPGPAALAKINASLR